MPLRTLRSLLARRLSTVSSRLQPYSRALEWTGSITAIIASTLMASRTDNEFIAFSFYLLSSAAWILMGVAGRLHGMITMQAVLICTTVVGLYQFSR